MIEFHEKYLEFAKMKKKIMDKKMNFGSTHDEENHRILNQP